MDRQRAADGGYYDILHDNTTQGSMHRRNRSILENSVMALGDTFLEIVTPVEENTTAGRFLARRGGDGGYMVIVQVDDLAERRADVDGLGVRVVWETKEEKAAAFHMHPKDVGGAILSFDQMWPPESWQWAGPNWDQCPAANVSTIIAVGGGVFFAVLGLNADFDDPGVASKSAC